MYKICHLENPILDRHTLPIMQQRVLLLLQEPGLKAIILNFEKVTFMDSTGLGGLVQLLKTVRVAQVDLYLANVSEQVETLLKLTSMDQVFQFWDLNNSIPS